MKAMAPESDPNVLVEGLKYLWGVLLIPLGILWKKADNAASKEELAAAIKSASENARQLYANAEKDRAEANARFSEIREKAAERAEDITQRLHDLHVEVLKRK